VRFSKTDQLDELRAKIYLDSHINLSKKELLEIIFDIGIEDYGKIVETIKQRNTEKEDNVEMRKDFIEQFNGCISLEEDEDEVPDFKSIWVKNIEE